MHLDKYPVKANDSYDRYEFLSEGPNGPISKIVKYQKISHNIYNLAFGDWNEETNDIDTIVRTNNLDRAKVMATVASTVIDFMKHHPWGVLIAKGSTPSRTRLYQMAVSTYLGLITIDFNIKGFYNQEWETFAPNKNYEGFLLEARQKW